MRKHLEFTWPIVLVQNIYEAMIENIRILTTILKVSAFLQFLTGVIHFTLVRFYTVHYKSPCQSNFKQFNLIISIKPDRESS